MIQRRSRFGKGKEEKEAQKQLVRDAERMRNDAKTERMRNKEMQQTRVNVDTYMLKQLESGRGKKQSDGAWKLSDEDKARHVRDTLDFCNSMKCMAARVPAYMPMCTEKTVDYTSKFVAKIDQSDGALLFARAIIMNLIKAVLKGKGFRVTSYAKQRDAIAALTPLMDASKAEYLRETTAFAEYGFWREVQSMLYHNTSEGIELTTSYLWWQALITLLRNLMNSERSLAIMFYDELTKERPCNAKSKCDGQCTKSPSGTCIYARHPLWDDYKKDPMNLWNTRMRCALPAFLRALKTKGVARDAEREEKEQYEFVNDAKVRALEIPKEEKKAAFVLDTCRFCEHIRKDGLIGHKEAPLMCNAPCKLQTPNDTHGVPWDVPAQTQSQIAFARGIFMQSLHELAADKTPTGVLNFEVQRALITKYSAYVDKGELEAARSVVKESEAQVSAFVKSVMLDNVADYGRDRQVMLDTPRSWADAIVYYFDLFIDCEERVSKVINEALKKDRKCGKPDEYGECEAPCTAKTVCSRLGGETTKCVYKSEEHADRRKQSTSGIWDACGLTQQIWQEKKWDVA